MKTRFEYDIAISFAEEDRNAALALSLALAAVGIKKVYYYPDRLGATAGRPLKDELAAIYSQRAKYAVALISEDYLKKEYSMIEMEAIKERMIRETVKTYLIPVVMEDKLIELMPEIKQIGYVKWEANPKRIAAVIAEKLKKKADPDNKEKQKKLVDALLKKQCGNVIYASTNVKNMMKSENQQITTIINSTNK